jgi:hypothetical protein
VVNQGSYFDLLVSLDPLENLVWRRMVGEAAQGDKGLREALRQAAFDDVLFFFQGFLWCYEPRAEIKVQPFCLWPHQVPAILAIDKAITDSARNMEEPIDVLMDKSRVQGGSLIDIGVILHRCLRDDMFAAGLVSRNMDCADNANDPDSLMWKLDWELKMLPWWMKPLNSTRLVSKHSWSYGNGSSVIAYAATGDVCSGGRKSVFDFDEVAKFDDQQPGAADEAMNSTQHVTNCRIFTSTHKGDSGVWYDMIFGDNWVADGPIFPWGGSGVYRNSSGSVKIILDWRDNPTQNRLAYRYVGGDFFSERPEEAGAVAKYIKQIKANGNLEKLKRRGYVKEGRLRSPWYDRKCLQKAATPRGIAQELDRDPRGTVGKLFNTDVLDRMTKEKVKAPVWEGRPVVHDGELRLVPQEGGPLKLWFKPGLDDESPAGKYAVGADVGTGAGEVTHSNSALIGGNCRTGEQVLEYVDPGISPSRFARLAVAVCRWLNNAMLIWESQGPTGGRFGSEVRQDIGYGNIWLRPKNDTWSRGITTSQAGWCNNRTSDKADLFEDLWVAMDDDLFTPRSDDFIKECGGWEWKEKRNSQDRDEIIYRGTGHGDRVIAGGLCQKAMKDLSGGIDKSGEIAQTAPVGSIAWFEEQDRIRVRKKKGDDVVDFGVNRFVTAKLGVW